MRIVLAVRQRFFAGQAAQYQQARVGVDDGIETALARICGLLWQDDWAIDWAIQWAVRKGKRRTILPGHATV